MGFQGPSVAFENEGYRISMSRFVATVLPGQIRGDIFVFLNRRQRPPAPDHDTHSPVRLVDMDDGVELYLAIVWTLGAPIPKPRAAHDGTGFAGKLMMHQAVLVEHLGRYSGDVRAVEVQTRWDRYMLVAFYDLDPRALDAVAPFLTAQYDDVTVLEIDF